MQLILRRPSPFLSLLVLIIAASMVVSACADDLVEVDPGEEEGAPDGPGTRDDGAVRLDDDGPVGSMAAALLQASVPQAVLEIDTSEGVELAGGAASALADRLAEHGGKSVSEAGANPLPGRDVWSRDDLEALSAEHRSQRSGDGAVAIHVLVLNGAYEEEGVTGVAFGASSFAVFPEQVRGGLVGSLTGSGAAVEEAVAVHELGHLFGLVNLTGQGAFHEDPEHPGHAQSTDSVMFWAVETDAVSQIFGGPPPSTFNGADVEEMSRIRGG